MSTLVSTCGWWRKYFTDHLLYVQNPKGPRPPEVWANTLQDKICVYCTKCLEQDIGCIMQGEEECERQDLSFFKRTPEEIKLACE
jgi:hypothetical protein